MSIHGEQLDIDNVNAIYDYVRGLRATELAAHPNILPMIQDFETWYQGLDVNNVLITGSEVALAERRRDDINAALGQKIPDNWVPADVPQTPPPVPDKPADEFFGGVEKGLTWAGLIAGAILLWQTIRKK